MTEKSVPWRTQPPSIQDPPAGEADLDYMGVEVGDEPSEKQETEDTQPNWKRRAKEAYTFSTNYVDSNYRKQWEDSIRAFNNQHTQDSKYNSDFYAKRSKIYRPKVRSIIRKNEAAAAAAFFSNLDRTSVTALNQADQKERISAEIMSQLLQYRLTKSIPWFLIVQGAMQDAQVQGACVAHVYWDFESRNRGEHLEVITDKPAVDLIPIENIRFDPSASWTDPINTSPYVVHLIPMYVCDVKERMDRPDPKGRTWAFLSDADISEFVNRDSDSTRSQRQNNRQDPAQQQRPVSDYDIVWIHRHIHRWMATDYEFYTIESEFMLTEAAPLSESVFHGKRPYVMGTTMIETHKALPTSVPSLTQGLTDQTNELANQRLDNIKLVLNKRYLVKRGKNVDLPSLVRNVPGGITMADDVADVLPVEFQDVTGSAYVEQDRINLDFDELVGNFSPASIQTNGKMNETVGGMQMLEGSSNLITEYGLKTFVETFVSPVLRQIVLLEQKYETDQTVLELVGQKAQLRQKYGMDKVTDEMLERELNITVNVGMGATDPGRKLQRFGYGVTLFGQIAKLAPPGMNLQEIGKEIFGLTGYQDGERFFSGQDPEKVKMQMQIKQLMMLLQKQGITIKDKHESNVVKMQTSREKNATAIAVEHMKQHHEKRMFLADAIMQASMPKVPNNG